jgi:hypothetical protein
VKYETRNVRNRIFMLFCGSEMGNCYKALCIGAKDAKPFVTEQVIVLSKV